MIRNKIWLLSILAPFGLLGMPLHRPALYMLLAFGLFLGLYRIDERDLATLGRAALVSLFVTVFAYMLGAPWFMMVMNRMPKSVSSPAWDVWMGDLISFLGWSVTGIIVVNVGSFLVSYFYLNVRGLNK
jgi:hypothetical protein